MIISHRHQFIFIHIPKCGGTTVRTSLKRFDDDGWFVGGGNTPPFGILDRQHLPLDFLRQNFPNKFQLFKTYQSFTVLRDVRARFRSSLAQYCKVHYQTSFAGISWVDQRDLVDKLFTKIPKGVATMDYRYTHFIPQYRFVEDEGIQIIQKLYNSSQIKDLPMLLRKDFGLKIEADEMFRRNESLRHRSKFSEIFDKTIRRAAPTRLKEVIPARVKSRLRSFALRPVRKEDVYPEFEAHTGQFIKDFYAKDIVLNKRIGP